MPLTRSNVPLIRYASLLLLLLLAMAIPGLANADCSTSNASASLGTVSSFSLQTTSDHVQSAGGMSCSSLATLLTTSYIRATMTAQTPLTGAGGASGYSVPFTVYADSGYTQAVTLGQYTELDNITLVNLLSTTTSSVPLYIATQAANVPAGVYTGTVTINWQYAVCTSLGVGSACLAWSESSGLTLGCLGLCAPTDWGSGATSTVTITLTVTKSCQIDSAPDVNFGTQALLSGFSSITQNVGVHCTLTEGYLLGFDMGDNGAAPWRRMLNGSNAIQYNLYYPSTSTVWNTDNPQALTGLGGPPVAGQDISYQAVIDATQTPPPVGTYTDNVRVIVTY